MLLARECFLFRQEYLLHDGAAAARAFLFTEALE
jgi:hypothetical protein